MSAGAGDRAANEGEAPGQGVEDANAVWPTKVSSRRTRIIVPCYNEATRFQSSAFNDFLASSKSVDFVFVNDGSRDETGKILRALEERWGDRATFVDQQPNQGKAEAVRVGVLRAIREGADYVGYIDADLATPLDAIAEFVEILDLQPEIDIVLGARVALLGRHIDRKPARHYLGRVFATAASLVLALPVYDTQCGAKLLRIRPGIRQLFDKPFGSRWIFDVEMLARYITGPGHSGGIYELPLQRWTDVGESRLRPRDFLRAGGEMAAIYRSYRFRRDLDVMLGVLSAPLVRYAGAGGVGTLVHYATLSLVVEVFGISPTPATAVGALFGAGCNYILNYHFTFASDSPHRRTLPKFLLIAALSALISAGGMWYAIHRFHIYYLVAQVICTGAVLLLGYVLNKVWTFRSSPIAEPAESRAHGMTTRHMPPP